MYFLGSNTCKFQNPIILRQSSTVQAVTLPVSLRPSHQPINGAPPAMLLLCSHQVVSNSATTWTVARQAPLSRGFFRQEYWTELPFSSPGGMHWQADSLPLSHQGSPNSCGTQAQLLHGMWDLPRPGVESMSPAMPGGFFLQYIILYISGWQILLGPRKFLVHFMTSALPRLVRGMHSHISPGLRDAHRQPEDRPCSCPSAFSAGHWLLSSSDRTIWPWYLFPHLKTHEEANFSSSDV